MTMALISATPSLDDLPLPPAGNTGWPWTEASPRLPDRMDDGRPWPRISIVTPSYNQAEYLEETIRSVLLQGYPDLEYVIMDGGSTDGTAEIMRKYEPWLASWRSGPDRGQSDAINRGFERTTGTVMAWLNSDDIYPPGTLGTVAREMTASGCDILFGAMDKVLIDGDDVTFVKRSVPWVGQPIHTFPILEGGRQYMFHFYQPSMFWSRTIWERAGGLDERYHYVMDMEWCNRALAAGAEVATVDHTFSRFALHAGSKSQDFMHRLHLEHAMMYLRLSRRPEFRTIPCLLSSLSAVHAALSRMAAESRRTGRRTRWFLLRGLTFGLGTARSIIPALRGAPRLTGEERVS
jgi:glycosyltransferase involved in cell wall biosynthesis